MAGLIEVNSDIRVFGKVTVEVVPNETGTVLLYGAANNGTISTRTNAQFIADLGLATANDFVKKSGDTITSSLASPLTIVRTSATNNTIEIGRAHV